MNAESQYSEYWCHCCRSITSYLLLRPEFVCPQCRSELIEEVTQETDPQEFVLDHSHLSTGRPEAPFTYTSTTTIFNNGQSTAVIVTENMPPPTSFFEIRRGVFGDVGLIEEIVRNAPEAAGAPPTAEHVINQLRTFQASEASGECLICHEEFQTHEELLELPCNHSFHTGCVTTWLKLHNTCPTCRCSLVSAVSSSDHCTHST